ncbi:D-amino acid dehydrogenase [Burkholderiaceae bacterium DAT-1]|nr:D-amino acid dehydrogenase [Burkholderiaceae bacterium DAT-1]
MKVIVLGAGITGVCTAWFLHKQGYEVTVLDRQPDCALETSFANGGQVSVSQSEPWACPDAPGRIIRWLGQDDSPLLFRPKMDSRQWRWALAFLRECLPGAVNHNIRQMVALGAFSKRTLRALRAETGIQYDQQTKGILQLYFDDESFDKACLTSETLRSLGCERKAISVFDALEMEPALRSVSGRLAGVTYAPDDESGDARKFTHELKLLAERAGVEFRFNTCILSLETDGQDIVGVRTRSSGAQCQLEKADAYVVCLGSYSADLLQRAGIYVPIYPAKGYSVTMPIQSDDLAPRVSITDESARLVYSRLGDRIRIAGTAEFCGFNTDLNKTRCESLLKRYFATFPDSAVRQDAQLWTGLRPSTPSNVPILGRSRYPSLYVNSGHGTLGWTEGPGSGLAIATLVSGQNPELDFSFWHDGGRARLPGHPS